MSIWLIWEIECDWCGRIVRALANQPKPAFRRKLVSMGWLCSGININTDGSDASDWCPACVEHGRQVNERLRT